MITENESMCFVRENVGVFFQRFNMSELSRWNFTLHPIFALSANAEDFFRKDYNETTHFFIKIPRGINFNQYNDQ